MKLKQARLLIVVEYDAEKTNAEAVADAVDRAITFGQADPGVLDGIGVLDIKRAELDDVEVEDKDGSCKHDYGTRGGVCEVCGSET